MRKNNKKYRGPLSKLKASERRVIRKEIYERDNYICWICLECVDITLQDGDPLAPTLDHVIPHSEGGKDNKRNLRLAHAKCNNDRHNTSSFNHYLQKGNHLSLSDNK